MEQKTIVRMPPSPTGSLHLGTARTALFNYLFAKKTGGEIVFRWEDTDQTRSKKEFETEILEGLQWLGMDFEKESKKIHRQTENQKQHKAALEKLWKKGHAFPCFVPPEEIEVLREKARNEKKGFVFWSPFRDLEKTEAEQKMKESPFVWRIKTPQNQEILHSDLIKGTIKVNTQTLGDFVVARSDGSVLYLLANVTDDLEANITHIIRGDDHISNTPKQILIYQALEKNPPKFAHIPLIIDKQKKKLSKRNVDKDVAILIKDFQKNGFLPEAVVNGLAFLGWHPKTTDEIFGLLDLEKIFDLKNVNKASAQYDYEKMKWFNGQWIRRISLENLSNYYFEFFGKRIKAKYLELAREKSTTLLELQDELSYLVEDPGFSSELLVHEKFGLTAERSKNILSEIFEMLETIDEEDFSAGNIRAISIEKIKGLGLKNGEFLWPFRVALSNRAGSAGPFETASVLGKAQALKRLKRACS